LGRKGKQITLRSSRGRGEQIFEEDYEVLKSFILEKLAAGPTARKDLEAETVRLFELAFEDDIFWLFDAVVDDLQLNKHLISDQDILKTAE